MRIKLKNNHPIFNSSRLMRKLDKQVLRWLREKVDLNCQPMKWQDLISTMIPGILILDLKHKEQDHNLQGKQIWSNSKSKEWEMITKSEPKQMLMLPISKLFQARVRAILETEARATWKRKMIPPHFQSEKIQYKKYRHQQQEGESTLTSKFWMRHQIN